MRRQTGLSFFSHIFPKLLLSHGEMSSRIITPWNTARQRKIAYSGACIEEERDTEREKEGEKMRSDPKCVSCSDGDIQREKWGQILTLCSNPITLPNWIGCVHHSDRIRALNWPLDLHFWFCLVGRQGKPLQKKYPYRETAPLEI